MSKIKKMCKAAKNGYKSDNKEIIEQVKNPSYICKECLRTAEDKKLLCNPDKIK